MLRSWLSINGLYEYDDTIFDNFQVPSIIDKDTLIARLIMDCAELEILFVDPDFMKLMIGYWSKSKLPIWNRLADTIDLKYNILDTRHITEGHVESIGKTEQKDGAEKTHGETTTNTEAHDDMTGKVSAYNTDTFENRDKNDTISDANQHYVGDGNRGYTEKITDYIRRGIDRTETGNTGTISPQDLIKQQREIALFDLYDKIIQDFKFQFCLLVY